MIRGAGPGKFLVLLMVPGPVPVVGWKKLAALPRHTCGGGTSWPRPAVLQSCCLQFGRRGGAPRMETESSRAAGGRVGGGGRGHEGAVGRVVDARGGEGEGERWTESESERE